MNEQSIFLSALDFADPDQRAEYLDRACGSDIALRARVAALLDAHQRGGDFLKIPALQQLAGDPGATQATAETNPDDDRIDLSFLEPATGPNSLGRLRHYEIRELIGHGGCGIVLKAWDERLERIVAIKVIAPALAITSPARKRFLREARATAAIRHDNVVDVYAVEEFADNKRPLPFLVMDFIDGLSLQQQLDRTGPLEIPEVVAVGQQLAAGLTAAHAKGLIHRDIKPANILLERGSRRVKITDFGLARTTDDASLTQSGIIAGTPMYMSPEQAQGLPIDQRSDLFSLGSVLYVMCTGRPPFRAPSTLAVIKRVVDDDPRPIQEVIPEVPDWLVAVIAILLAKSPEDRFDSAAQVAALLADCQAQLAQTGQVLLPPEVVAKVPSGVIGRRHTRQRGVLGRRIALGVGLLLAVGMLAGLTVWMQAQRLADVLSVAADPSGSAAADVSPTEATLPLEPPGSAETLSTEEPTDGQAPTLAPDPEPSTNRDVPLQPVAAVEDTSPAEPAEPSLDLLPVGSYWLGSRNYRAGAYAGSAVHYELHVRQRDGNVFRGHVFDNGRGRNRAEVEGVVLGNQVTWTEKARGNVLTMRADLIDDRLEITFHGHYSNGATNRGDGQLQRIRDPQSP